MADTNTTEPGHDPAEPRGFGEHTRGLAGEYAHEQGWQLNEDERRKQPRAGRTPMAAPTMSTARRTLAMSR